jgi:hypothetical protein
MADLHVRVDDDSVCGAPQRSEFVTPVLNGFDVALDRGEQHVLAACRQVERLIEQHDRPTNCCEAFDYVLVGKRASVRIQGLQLTNGFSHTGGRHTSLTEHRDYGEAQQVVE